MRPHGIFSASASFILLSFSRSRSAISARFTSCLPFCISFAFSGASYLCFSDSAASVAVISSSFASSVVSLSSTSFCFFRGGSSIVLSRVAESLFSAAASPLSFAPFLSSSGFSFSAGVDINVSGTPMSVSVVVAGIGLPEGTTRTICSPSRASVATFSSALSMLASAIVAFCACSSQGFEFASGRAITRDASLGTSACTSADAIN
mmetsp:Transcript_81307/g.126840  ORF Transcript_81307/g.126840 Transcript_81307/m.126840 type:complete len:206 (-) Transcript_81307:81-698(-)